MRNRLGEKEGKSIVTEIDLFFYLEEDFFMPDSCIIKDGLNNRKQVRGITLMHHLSVWREILESP